MANVHFGLVGKSKNRHGLIPIYMTITQNRKLARYCTKVEIPSPSCWNAEKECVYARTNTPDAKKQNEELNRLKSKAVEAENIVKESGDEVTAKAIMDIFRKLETNTLKNRFSFFEFVEEAVHNAYNNRQYAIFRKYDIFLRRLKSFVNGVRPDECYLRQKKDDEIDESTGKDILFTDINYQFLTDYELYLHQLPNNCQKGLLLKQTTIRKEMATFKALFAKGVNCKEDEGLNIGRNPFEKYKCKRGEPKLKAKLTIEEIDALESLDLPEQSPRWNARNCFLFAYYTGGIRFGDVIQIRGCFISKVNGHYRLKYTMDKTSKEKDDILNPEAIEILEKYIDLDNPSTKYVFPYLNNNAPYAKAITPEERDALSADETRHLKQNIGSKNALVNKYLKELAKMAGINKHLCTHIARHSCADTLRREGVPIHDIKDTLGHTSADTTEGYLNQNDTITRDNTIMKLSRKTTHPKENKADELLKLIQQLDENTRKTLLEKLNNK